jgi:hypothetical protein
MRKQAMTARDRPDPIANPWSARVVVAQIPEAGLHRDIEADEAARMALAKIANVRDIESARASFDLTPGRDDSVHVRGRVSARVGQTCVVSLDPIENDIAEDVDLLFVPLMTMPARRAATFRMRPSPSSTASSISDASRPTCCFWESILIRGNPMPCSCRHPVRSTPRTIPSPP